MHGKYWMSEQLYAALLILYPKEFRAAYSRQMRLTFRDACRKAYQQNGDGGLLALWLPTLLDLFKTALEEQARQGAITMSNEIDCIRWAADHPGWRDLVSGDDRRAYTAVWTGWG
jgi:hypothetical protein